MDSSHTDSLGLSSRRRRREVQLLEWLVVLHLGGFLIAATWAYGGQASWVRGPLTAFGGIGCFLTLAAGLQRGTESRSARRVLWCLVPLALFNGLVLLAATNPNLHEVRQGAETILVPFGSRPGLPSSARPGLARDALLEFDVIWLACFNVLLVLSHRRLIRTLLLVTAANALALAVFGTVQRLLHSPGLFFGRVPSPQRYFFASFVYHNHWGAFAVLMLGVCLGVTAHFTRRSNARDVWHSPALTGIVVILLLAATLPLSASRSATILGTLLLGAALAHVTAHLVRRRRHANESIVPPIAGATVLLAFALATIGYLGRDAIRARTALTIEQVHQARVSHTPDARVQLYGDTWRMARQKPWFGWGMASYPYIFTLFNSRQSRDGLPVFYHDAHSDWLQSLAEHGAVGTALLILSAALPLVLVGRRVFTSPVSLYLLAGCALIVGYAALEFPFGNYAVVLTWWLCFFGALQYARLTSTSGTSQPFAAARA